MNSLWKSLTGSFNTPSIQTRYQEILTTPINLGPGLTQQDQMLRTHMVNFVQGDDHTTAALLAKSWRDAWTKPEMVNELVDEFTQLARSATVEELRDVISGGTNGPGNMMLILLLT